ncbi:uncharacterized protein LOC133183547 [Saccostrea echinata]|uniref:uncharacterized protein LOC133183547 n=1 Tax=Saccostrea echinata TaxID=191078 RepID=UPI002A806DA3|nr:uncharacterized protein LOC133183547 [Saccostrea echinata]
MKWVMFLLSIVFNCEEIHSAVLVQKARVKSLTKVGIPSLKLCIQTCIRTKSIDCQYLKYNTTTQQCLMSESKYAELAGWVSVKPEQRQNEKVARLFLERTHANNSSAMSNADSSAIVAQMIKILQLEAKSLELQKLLSTTENLITLRGGQHILSPTVISLAKRKMQVLHMKLMRHQQQVTMSSVKLLKSGSILMNSRGDEKNKTAFWRNFNRLIETLRLDQKNIMHDILYDLLKTLQFYQQLQNYNLFIRGIQKPTPKTIHR